MSVYVLFVLVSAWFIFNSVRQARIDQKNRLAIKQGKSALRRLKSNPNLDLLEVWALGTIVKRGLLALQESEAAENITLDIALLENADKMREEICEHAFWAYEAHID